MGARHAETGAELCEAFGARWLPAACFLDADRFSHGAFEDPLLAFGRQWSGLSHEFGYVHVHVLVCRDRSQFSRRVPCPLANSHASLRRISRARCSSSVSGT